jgi:DNA-binding CsgD family transcriptional regulator
MGMLRGRVREVERLEQILRDIRAGDSRALVITGEAGVGKSALIEHLVQRATGCGVARAAGAEAEETLDFAALHQLCTPLLVHLDDIPEPQRDAIGTIFGLRTGPAPDQLLLGLAVLSLLAEGGSGRPLVCAIDDAHRLDQASAQVLGFVARRLRAESVALVFASRDAESDPSLAGLPRMNLGGLPPQDALELLAATFPQLVDKRVRERILAETRGNPLAIMELPRGLSQAELASGVGLSGGDNLSGRIEESFMRRLGQLSPAQRRLALLAAAEPLGDPDLLWRGAERLDIPGEAADPVAFKGLMQWGTRVTFRHPLVRSATYRAASPDERRAVHRVLAELTDPAIDADRRAWHLAQAAAGPDENVASELERSASRAEARGGYAASAALLERAAALSTDADVRAARTLAAADAKLRAGASDAALDLLAMAQTGPLDDLQRARVDLLRAEIAYARNRGDRPPALLLRAARQLEPLDLPLARDTYLEALAAAQFAGHMMEGGLMAAAEAARRAPVPATGRRVQDDLLDGLAVLLTEGYPAGAPLLHRALATFRSSDVVGDDVLRWYWLACRTAVDLWDEHSWRDLSERMVKRARETGGLTALPLALTLQLGPHLFDGDLDAVASITEELDAIKEATGVHITPYGAVFRAALQGRETEASALVDSAIEEAKSRGEGQGVTGAIAAKAILANGLGRHADALAAAERACAHPEESLALHNWATVELIEAAARCGERERAIDAAERLTERTLASGTGWALGVEARSWALLSEGDDAERLYRKAISRLSQTHVRVELARAHLLYGEWLRRAKRRVDARHELRGAYDMFSAMGAEAFAERARSELVATGETVRKRSADSDMDLTNREAQVARLARDGLSNPEIGTRLYLSPRTVEYHLRKVFRKLGIASRTELARLFNDLTYVDAGHV